MEHTLIKPLNGIISSMDIFWEYVCLLFKVGSGIIEASRGFVRYSRRIGGEFVRGNPVDSGSLFVVSTNLKETGIGGKPLDCL